MLFIFILNRGKCLYMCHVYVYNLYVPDEYLRFSDKIKLLDLLLSRICKNKKITQ